ncbi:MAG TPA: ATP-binding protein [Egibacteraceae bacterium]|jgi:serine/threonine-protein kinase RsbW|nr:ATP-binding protein [Egibacteraceae bacterium]
MEKGGEADVLFSIQLSLPRDARFVSLLRNVAGCVFDDIGAPREATNDIQVALTEACANAIRHAVGSNAYSVAFSVDAEGCEIEVVDLGPGFELPADILLDPEPDGENETGRGVLLMRALVDDLQFIRQEDGTSVTLRKYWPEVGLALVKEVERSQGRG